MTVQKMHCRVSINSDEHCGQNFSCKLTTFSDLLVANKVFENLKRLIKGNSKRIG